MTQVTRAADARLAASIRSSSSMMFSAGGFVGWTIKASAPRTFSSIRTKISPSANRVSVILHSSTPRCLAISSASPLLALPEINLNARRTPGNRSITEALKRRREDRKSTRLNSSHGDISYAFFCLKKKKNLSDHPATPQTDSDCLFVSLSCAGPCPHADVLADNVGVLPARYAPLLLEQFISATPPD